MDVNRDVECPWTDCIICTITFYVCVYFIHRNELSLRGDFSRFV